MNTLKMGKSEAREKFLPLVDSLSQKKTAIEITDRGHPVAVLIDYASYLALLTKSGIKKKPSFELVGSLVEIGDIEEGSREIAAELNAAIERSASEL